MFKNWRKLINNLFAIMLHWKYSNIILKWTKILLFPYNIVIENYNIHLYVEYTFLSFLIFQICPLLWFFFYCNLNKMALMKISCRRFAVWRMIIWMNNVWNNKINLHGKRVYHDFSANLNTSEMWFEKKCIIKHLHPEKCRESKLNFL